MSKRTWVMNGSILFLTLFLTLYQNCGDNRKIMRPSSVKSGPQTLQKPNSTPDASGQKGSQSRLGGTNQPEKTEDEIAQKVNPHDEKTILKNTTKPITPDPDQQTVDCGLAWVNFVKGKEVGQKKTYKYETKMYSALQGQWVATISFTTTYTILEVGDDYFKEETITEDNNSNPLGMLADQNTLNAYQALGIIQAPEKKEPVTEVVEYKESEVIANCKKFKGWAQNGLNSPGMTMDQIDVEVRDEQVTVPAGTYQCKYSESDSGGEVGADGAKIKADIKIKHWFHEKYGTLKMVSESLNEDNFMIPEGEDIPDEMRKGQTISTNLLIEVNF